MCGGERRGAHSLGFEVPGSATESGESSTHLVPFSRFDMKDEECMQCMWYRAERTGKMSCEQVLDHPQLVKTNAAVWFARRSHLQKAAGEPPV